MSQPGTRVLLDTNVLISYLLRRDGKTSVVRTMRALMSGGFVLLLPSRLWDEVVDVAANRRKLSSRIDPKEVEGLRSILWGVAEIIPLIEEPLTVTTRDPNDDYVLSYAQYGEADYLVTGDRDLLVLRQVGRLRIVSPQEFADLAAESSED